MDRAEGGTGFVIATYREIAAHFGYGGKQPDNVARMKAKRAGWRPEPQNHPLETVRVRVPREAWDRAGAVRDSGLLVRRHSPLEMPGGADTGPDNALPGAAQSPPSGKALRALEEAVAVLREQLGRAEARAARAEARETAERARAERLEAERDAARAELAAWMAGVRSPALGGPLPTGGGAREHPRAAAARSAGIGWRRNRD